MAKDNVNVADELKDEKQKANLTQLAKEAEAAQAIAGTDTDEEATTNDRSKRTPVTENLRKAQALHQQDGRKTILGIRYLCDDARKCFRSAF